MSVYLLQPCELVNTNRYKIGCSSKIDLKRVRSYKTGTRYLGIIKCDNYFEVEKMLIKKFNENFNKIAGNEYYEGDEEIMLDLFLQTVIKYKKNNLTSFFEKIITNDILNNTFKKIDLKDDILNNAFKNDSNEQINITNNNIKGNTCNTCNKTFKYHCRLNAHLSKKNSCKSSKKLYCADCNIYFRYLSGQIKHNKTTKHLCNSIPIL